MNQLISIPIILSLIVKIKASSMSTVTKTKSTSTSTSSSPYSYISNSYSHSAQSTTSYSYELSVPTAYDPYVIHHHDINGTVFISVGTLIISFFMFLLLARFWFYLQNRKAAKNTTDIDEYFGSVYYNEKENLLNYDTHFLNSKKELSSYNSSSNASFFSNSSTHSNSSINGINNGNNVNNNNNNNIHNNLSNLTSQQGRPLRSAMTSNRRNSYISPINELINDSDINNSNENSMFNSPDVNSNQHLPSSTISTPILTNLRHKKASSIDNLRDKHHSRSTSLNLHELEKLVNKSLIEVDLTSPDVNESATSFNIQNKTENKSKDRDGEDKKKQRPPSIVLDMLVNDNLDL